MNDVVVDMKDVEVIYHRKTRAVDQVSLEIKRGETVGIVGESGSGKSTICRLIAGLVNASSGRLHVRGRAIKEFLSKDSKTFRRQVQILMQDASAALSPRMTVIQLITEAVAIHGLDPDKTRQRIEQLFERLRLPPSIYDRYPHEISGGQARRIGVIRALLLEPSLIVADEPTAGLDVSVQGELLNLLLEFQREMDLTLIMVSHNLHIIKRVTRRTIVMYLGQIIEDSPTSEIFTDPSHPYTVTLLSTNPLLSSLGTSQAIILQGEVPSNALPPSGCRFHTRCPVVQSECKNNVPALREISPGRKVRCHFPNTLPLPTKRVHQSSCVESLPLIGCLDINAQPLHENC